MTAASVPGAGPEVVRPRPPVGRLGRSVHRLARRAGRWLLLLGLSAALAGPGVGPAAAAGRAEPLSPVAPAAGPPVRYPDGIPGGAMLASAGPVVAVPPGVPGPPVARSTAYLVADADTGEVLAAKGAHLRLPPASTLKTLTALAVAPRLAPGTIYRAGRADADAEGSRVGIVAGGTYTVRDLFYGLFLRSGNDAASALANAAGGWPSTVAGMNATARRLGALDTVAVNPSGLDEPGQLSSAYDLALIGRALLAEPSLRDYPTRVHYAFPGAVVPAGRARPSFEIRTQQKFVEHYPGALGLKNGYTTLAHNTLVTAARRNGRTVLVTLLGSPGGAWREAAALNDWAFAYAGVVQPVGRLDGPAPAAADGRAADATSENSVGPPPQTIAAVPAAIPMLASPGTVGSRLPALLPLGLLLLALTLALLRGRTLTSRRRIPALRA